MQRLITPVLAKQPDRERYMIRSAVKTRIYLYLKLALSRIIITVIIINVKLQFTVSFYHYI